LGDGALFGDGAADLGGEAPATEPLADSGSGAVVKIASVDEGAEASDAVEVAGLHGARR
jgi:hypothetical protein